jgi:hypothetical protein
VKRFATATIVALWCIGSGPAPAWSESLDVFGTRWRWQEGNDPITDAPVRQAWIATAVIDDKPFAGDEARLAVSCVTGKADIVVDWNFKVAGKEKLVLEYRFDGLPGRAPAARYVNRSRQRVTGLADIRQFLSDARGSTRLLLRVNSDAYGPSSATFAADAGSDMVARFLAACPSVGRF